MCPLEFWEIGYLNSTIVGLEIVFILVYYNTSLIDMVYFETMEVLFAGKYPVFYLAVLI